MPDYIPRADGQFDPWVENFVAYAAAHRPQLGLTFPEITALTAARNAWTTAYTAHVAAVATAQGARAGKDTSRAVLEAAIRPLVRRIQATPIVTDESRHLLGITVADTTATVVPVPTTRPVLRIDSGQRLRHSIAFSDEATPARAAKPAGVLGAEIWMAITPAGAVLPSDPAAFRFVALDSRSPHTIELPGSGAGRSAHYIARWVNSLSQPGPWSQTATATIRV